MGGAWQQCPIISGALVTCLWGLAGLPGALSFFSKTGAITGGVAFSWVGSVLGVVGIVFAVGYRIRLGRYFAGPPVIRAVGNLAVGPQVVIVLATGGGGLFLSGWCTWSPTSQAALFSWPWEAAVILGSVAALGAGIREFWGDKSAFYHAGRILSLHSSIGAPALWASVGWEQTSLEAAPRRGVIKTIVHGGRAMANNLSWGRPSA